MSKILTKIIFKKLKKTSLKNIGENIKYCQLKMPSQFCQVNRLYQNIHLKNSKWELTVGI